MRRTVIDMVAVPIEIIITMIRAIVVFTDRMSFTHRLLLRIDRDTVKSTRLYHRHRRRRRRRTQTTQIRVVNIDECRRWK